MPERDGERHPHLHGAPALEARREPALADGLDGGLVAPPADAADDADVRGDALLVDDELDEDAALDASALRHLGVLEEVLQPLDAADELGHLLDHLENLQFRF